MPMPTPMLPPVPPQGYLFPDFHRSYWFGLGSNSSFYPIFGWTDPVFPGPTQNDYRHWGTFKTAAGDDIPEPNNQFGPEYCAVCNATQAYGGAFGWADANCNQRFAQMCRIQGEHTAGGGCCPRLPILPLRHKHQP